MTLRLFLFLLFLSQGLLIAQTDSICLLEKGPDRQFSGLGICDADLIDLLMVTMPGFGEESRSLLAEQSLKAYMMPPRKVPFAEASGVYSLAALLEYYVNYEQNFKDNLSPDFILLSRAGKELREGFALLAQEGTVSATIVPYGSQEISRAVYNTARYRIENYLHLFRPGTRGLQKIFETRKALVRGNPVLVDLLVTPDFTRLTGDYFWQPLGQETSLPVTAIVVGYDQDLEAFELYGCWGMSWGVNGYLWVSYRDFSRYVQNGYVLVPDNRLAVKP